MDLDKRSKDCLIANYSKQIKLSAPKLFNYNGVEWSGAPAGTAQQQYSFTQSDNSHLQGIRKGEISCEFSHPEAVQGPAES